MDTILGKIEDIRYYIVTEDIICQREMAKKLTDALYDLAAHIDERLKKLEGK